MSSDNQMINLIYIRKEKKNTLNEQVLAWSASEKLFNRLNSVVGAECSKRCLSNFKTDKFTSDEKLCLSNCFTKFYDVLEIGEGIYDKLTSGNVNLSPMIEGNFKEIIKQI